MNKKLDVSIHIGFILTIFALRNLKNCTNKTPYKCLKDVKVGANNKNQLIILD